MTTVNENAPQKKRIATYGKAIRKRLPEYAGHNEHQEGSYGVAESHKDASHLHAVYGLPRIPRSQRSSPARSTTSVGSNVFDFPSSDEAEDATPKKRRKIANNDLQLKRRSPKSQVITRETSRSPRLGRDIHDDKSMTTSKGLSSLPSKVDEKAKNIQKQREPSGNTDAYGRHPPEPIFGVHRSSPSNPARRGNATLSSVGQTDAQIKADPSKNSFLTKNEKSQGRIPKTHHDRNATYREHPRSTSTPPPVHLEESSMKEYSESHRASPTILTPKGLKMWDGLLGDDVDDSPQELDLTAGKTSSYLNINGNVASQRYGQQPRRRLIDSLVNQSKGSEPLKENLSESSDEAESLDEIDQSSQQHSTSVTKQDAVEPSNLKGTNTNMAPAASTTGPKITYSRQRSMLAEPDFMESISFELTDHPSLSQSSNRSQNRRGIERNATLLPGLHSTDEDEEGPGGAIRSVHELRQAGATKRYLDEMEDLLDRIGDSSVKASLRRSGLLELAEKMHGKEFYRNFINNAMDQRLFLRLGLETDVISGFLLVSLILVILDAGITPVGLTHLRDQGVTQLLTRMIDSQDEIIVIAKDRKSNMSKAAQVMLMEEQHRLLELAIWNSPKPNILSPRTVTLASLELLVRQAHEAGSHEEFMSKDLIRRLFDVLRPLCHRHSQGGLTVLEITNSRLSLSILEAQSLNVAETDRVWYDEYFPLIRDLLKNIVAATLDDRDSLQNLVLRLTLNITNNNSSASDIFATPELMESMSRAIVQKLNMLSHFLVEAERLVVVDQLVLMLGVMINFAEWSSHARQCFVILTEANQNPLDDMVRIFSDNLEKTSEADSMESIHLNVAFGYLSVLLGTLCLSSDVANRVRLKLPGTSLQPLVTSIEEFISHHKKVDSLLEDEEDGHDSQTNLTQRLSRVVEALREKIVL